MLRRFVATLGSVVALTAAGSAVTPAVTATATANTAATAPAKAPQTLSITDRLDDRRFVASGDRAYEVGTEAGRYPAMGFHTSGEMGGIWSPPIKLLDGIWFGVGNSWVGPAERFTSGWGYTKMDLPATGGVTATRTDFVPDGRRAVVVGLKLTSAGATQSTVTLKVDAHSELMDVYPWGGTTPSQTTFNLPDAATVSGSRLVFREQGKPDPNAPAHDWAAVVGGTGPNGPLPPTGSMTGPNFRGPQDPAVICPTSGVQPARCDDTGFGKGAGGELQYRVTVPAHGGLQLWFTVAGSDQGLAAAQVEYGAASSNPAGELAAKMAARRQLAQYTTLDLPGDPLLAQGIDWSKQNLADLVQESQGLNIRVTHAGTVYPPSQGTLDQIRFIGAGFPDYPWMFATDGEYTAFAAVGVGQFQAIEDHLRSLMMVSQIANGSSGKVVHETVTDGSVYFGANTDAGNTDETVKFPSAVALVWRWTGDNTFLNQMYDFTKRNLHYVVDKLDVDHDGWPEGGGNVELPGQGVEKLDSSVYLIRGLLDEAEMAASKHDTATEQWASSHAKALMQKFEAAWWAMPQAPGYADSLQDPGNVKLFQRYWTGVTPMEAELWADGHTVPGLATKQHANPALDLRETPCFTGPDGLFEGGQGSTTAQWQPPQPTTPCDGDHALSTATDQKIIFTLNTAVMAVAEGNYGRLGANQQQFYTTANRALMLPTPDEMPGALEEIAPSPPFPPYYGDSLDRTFTQRAQVMQAWGNYGLIWPVVHQQLGISPDLGMGAVEVVPQVPDGQPSVDGRDIRLGTGSIDVAATARPGSYMVTVSMSRLHVALTMGYAVANGAHVSGVQLDGQSVSFTIRQTNRGQEVLVPVPGTGTGSHTLIVTTS